MGRTGQAATFAFLCAGAILAAFQVQRIEMPTLVFYILVGVMLIVGNIALVIVVFDGARFVAKLVPHWGLRSPLFRKDMPNPLQWLLDLAKKDEESPTDGVVIVRRRVVRWDFTARRPYVDLEIRLFNGSVHTLLFGKVTGHVSRGELLDDEVEDDNNGYSRVPRYHVDPLRLRQYIPKDQVESIYGELTDSAIRSLDFTGVLLPMKIDKEGATEMRLSLGNGWFIAEN